MNGNAPLSFVRGGRLYPGGEIEYRGNWSSYYIAKGGSSSVDYNLFFRSTDLVPQGATTNRAYGFSLRCVVRQEGGGENKE